MIKWKEAKGKNAIHAQLFLWKTCVQFEGVLLRTGFLRRPKHKPQSLIVIYYFSSSVNLLILHLSSPLAFLPPCRHSFLPSLVLLFLPSHPLFHSSLCPSTFQSSNFPSCLPSIHSLSAAIIFEFNIPLGSSFFELKSYPSWLSLLLLLLLLLLSH